MRVGTQHAPVVHRDDSTEVYACGGSADGVGALWARERISALSDTIVEGAPEDEVRPLIVATALEHRLVSRYTSLVAVDVTPIAPAGTEPPPLLKE